MAAHVNTKFIANPSFGIQSVGRQTLTLAWQAQRVVTVDADPDANPPVLEEAYWRGFNDISFRYCRMLPLVDALNIVEEQLPVPKSISLVPKTQLKVSTAKAAQQAYIELTPLEVFGDFIEKNPIHVTKLNVRASDISVLPSTMEVLTPNMFTGQFDRQIVNIVADTNMYQNQSNIVTLSCDFYIARNSILKVDTVLNLKDDGKNEPALMMDMSFDKYLSLEKALVENYELLTTIAGQENAISQELATVAAKVPAVAETMVQGPAAQLNVGTNWKPLFGSIQPSVAKGNNF